jgi:hypothetical protein
MADEGVKNGDAHPDMSEGSLQDFERIQKLQTQAEGCETRARELEEQIAKKDQRDLVALAKEKDRLIQEAENLRKQAHRAQEALKTRLYLELDKKLSTIARPLQQMADKLPAQSAARPITLQKAAIHPTPDLPLWVYIKRCTNALSFDSYNAYVSVVLCPQHNKGNLDSQVDPTLKAAMEGWHTRLSDVRRLPFNDTDAYRMLKTATEAFVMANCGVSRDNYSVTSQELDDLKRRISLGNVDFKKSDFEKLEAEYLVHDDDIGSGLLPYLSRIKQKFPELEVVDDASDAQHSFGACLGLLKSKLLHPCHLELIWSYWHEEGMLTQTLAAITTRFQNIRAAGDRDPLAMLEIDPLRGLNNLLWGYIQDEQHRLSLVRRVHEYDHQYGLSLVGQAVPNLRTADSRSKFLEAFHNLLHLCTVFYKEDDDTTVNADGFPVLNALADVHLLLTEGAHNQFGDLPSTARQEMLLQQFLLSRPEFREFLPTRIMVDYPEKWMDRVDAMKSLQGWTDTSIIHFHNLADFGEKILLSIRYGSWSTIKERDYASNWARYWRDEIQGYIHAYRSVTGVDLTSVVTDTQQAAARYLPPSVHLRRRLAFQMQRQRVPV